MAFIWRVENEYGEGMYVTDFGLHEMVNLDEALQVRRHPNPKYDHNLGYLDLPDSDLYSFGFASLSQFKQWVYKSDWRDKLDKAEFSLCKFRVPNEFYRRSNFQAIFRRDMAELVEARQVNYADL